MSCTGYGILECYNPTLPSAAAVQRLFSAATQALTTCRCRMSDETLNQHIFLRSQFNMTG